jgi:hypothetical protein
MKCRGYTRRHRRFLRNPYHLPPPGPGAGGGAELGQSRVLRELAAPLRQALERGEGELVFNGGLYEAYRPHGFLSNSVGNGLSFSNGHVT